jgi:hypothetical protein
MHPESLIDALLFEEEGTELDFKRDQYPFDGADERQKSELLKDILAFANAWRRSDAYILIGVQEVKGDPSTVFGVSGHLDDAKLQQFVNSKTNRPIEVSYTPVSYRSAQIGIIHLPVQERPTFLTKDYGALRRDTVYIRRGSSTDIARPDEIAKMGAAINDGLRSRPLLVPLLASGADWTELTEMVAFETVCLRHPVIKDLPDYDPRTDSGPFGMPVLSSMWHINRDFFRERAEYLRSSAKLRAVRFAVRNTGTALASGVKVAVQIDDPSNSVELILGSDRPKRPKTQWSPMANIRPIAQQRTPDVELKRTKSGWTVNALIGKVQAQDTALTSELLYIGVASSGSVQFSVALFADELSAPVRATLSIQFTVVNQEVTYDKLTQYRQ